MIELIELTKRYPGAPRPAVNGVSLRIEEGQLCVLIGPSGCGKTTTLKMINRLVEPTSGRILIGGVDVTKMDVIQLRRSIGYAIQEVGLFPHMTVAQNVALVPSLLGWSRERKAERVEELLTLVGLDPREFAHKYPRQLSGGQKQRVGVARALAADPPVLLMDEPFGAVDPITRERLQKEFKAIQDRLKKTVVFVTHDVNEALKLADVIVVMREGRAVQCGTPRAILERPVDSFVADFVGSDRALKKLTLIKVAEAADRGHMTIRAEQSSEEARQLLQSQGQSWAYVVDQGGRVLGYALASDLVRCEMVGQAVHAGATVVEQDETLSDALAKMLAAGSGTACVVDQHGRFAGCITLAVIERAVQGEVGHQE